MNLHALDIVVLLLVAATALLGAKRGFVAEVLALFAWVAMIFALKIFHLPLSRALAHQYAQALIATDRFDEAALYLRDQAQQYREERKLHDMLARTYAKQGKIALQHMSLAESYVLAGAVPAAMAQLELARKASDASFYDQAVIDARVRELQEKQKKAKEEAEER